MNLTICSRKDAQKLLAEGFPESTAVISFYDPPDAAERLDYSEKAERVFYVPLWDIDLSALPGFHLTEDTYFPEADDLARFIKAAFQGGLHILCQCEYGESRSSGCAAAILQFYKGKGIDIFADYRYCPNQLVYHKVYDALCK